MDNESPTNSVLEVKLDYIQRDIGVIKADIKEIKNDYISRREFTEAQHDLQKEIALLKKLIFGVIGIFGVAIVNAIVKLIIPK